MLIIGSAVVVRCLQVCAFASCSEAQLVCSLRRFTFIGISRHENGEVRVHFDLKPDEEGAERK